MSAPQIIGSVEFRDVPNEDDGFIIVKRYEEHIGVGISMLSDGDVEGYMSPAKIRDLIALLERSLL